MFYIRLTAVVFVILINLPVLSQANSWEIGKSENGDSVYYSKEGNGYYRKVSQIEVDNKPLPKYYIVADETGYYYHHVNENGGGGHYSYTVPEGVEEYYKSHGQVGHMVYYPSKNAVSYQYKCNCEKEEQSAREKDLTMAAFYPMYFDQ